jgi:hypothetical protein
MLGSAADPVIPNRDPRNARKRHHETTPATASNLLSNIEQHERDYADAPNLNHTIIAGVASSSLDRLTEALDPDVRRAPS